MIENIAMKQDFSPARRRAGVVALGPVLALSLALASTPASAQQVTYAFDQRLPGSYDDVVKLPSIGVIPLRGPDGVNFASAIAGELQAMRIGDQPVFSIRTEDSGAAPGKGRASDDAVFVRAAGAKLGVKGILWGTIISASVTSNNFTGSTVSCSGNSCHDVPIACIKYQGSYTVTPTIYSVDNSRILYTRQLKKDSVTDVCGGDVRTSSITGMFSNLFGKKKQEAVTNDSILTAMRLDAAKAVVADIMPQVRKMKIGFKAKFPEFDQPTQAKLNDAVAQLKSGRADKACGVFEATGDGPNTKQLSLLFNLAACHEVNADNKTALELYQAYDSRITKVDPMINEALKRMGAIK